MEGDDGRPSIVLNMSSLPWCGNEKKKKDEEDIVRQAKIVCLTPFIVIKR